MQMNVSTRQLRAFLALAEQRSFTRAAALSHLSQPAFSALIKALEDDLGQRLFDRSTRHVELSVEGREFELAARRVLAEFENALEGARDQVARRRGRVAIALLPSLAAGWLPQLLAEFRALYPGIELAVSDVLSEACIAQVQAGKADFALAATRAETPELGAELFCSDDFHLVCPVGHPLLAAKALRPEDLSAYPFVHLSRTSSVRQYLDAAVHPLQMKTLMEVDQLATVMGMVRAGLGISVVPALSLFHFQHAQIATRALPWEGLKRRIYLVRRRDRGLSLAAQSLYELAMARRPQTPPTESFMDATHITTGLAARLKQETRELHRQAERSGLMAALMRGSIGLPAYCALLRSLRAIYAALESALDAQGSDGNVQRLWRPELRRLPRLEQDLARLDPGSQVEDAATPYVQRLQALAKNEPNLLLAHAYLRYLGDLHGGQMLARVVRQRFGLDGDEGTAFYDFGEPPQLEQLKQDFRAGLDALVLTPQQADAFVAEACEAFRLHQQLFDALQREYPD
ncbi:DNA-binding transcriptional LysR family regulator [Roseateles toxinivorans]|uniref:DNA-binding transcriptional LysR family regulator n=2 Tax=Roseateles toxinivorans TaxID=270368 RepID=A0A4R6QQ44_9BURK|nr:DNA-binding transcriptional LysR family regulator [Roseateles toxinivorans]